MTTTPSKWAMERAAMLMHDRADVNQHHETIARALDAARREALEEAAEYIATDDNRRLDEYYCCSALDGSTQICGCQGKSIREDLNLSIRALMDKEPGA